MWQKWQQYHNGSEDAKEVELLRGPLEVNVTCALFDFVRRADRGDGVAEASSDHAV